MPCCVLLLNKRMERLVLELSSYCYLRAGYIAECKGEPRCAVLTNEAVRARGQGVQDLAHSARTREEGSIGRNPLPQKRNSPWKDSLWLQPLRSMHQTWSWVCV